jgi:DNA-binding transcriptional LysR family regulator
LSTQLSATTLRNRLLARARLRHLDVFVKVADLQMVKRAADAVGITQPSATQALADLEALLECSLFLRHAQGMALTTAGELLLPLARRMLGLVEDTATRAAGVVRVAAISAAVGGQLGDALPAFARLHPHVLVELVEADVKRQAELMAQHDIDVAICRCPPVLPAGWSFTPLWTDRFGIVARTTHPLAGVREVSMDDLLAHTWLVPPSSIAARAAFDRFFDDHSAAVRHYSVVSASPVMLWTLLSQEPLLSLVPLSVVQRFLQTGQLIQIAWPDAMPFDPIGVLVPETGRGPALNSLLEFLRS